MFKDLIKTGKHVNMGFPIAEVEYDGTFNIAKEKNSGGKHIDHGARVLPLTEC